MGAGLQVPAGDLRCKVRGLLPAGNAGNGRLSRPDQGGRAHPDRRGVDRAGLVQLACRLQPLPARRPFLPTTCSAASTSCRSRASIPSGRRSTLAPRCPASRAFRRPRSGSTARRARRRKSDEARGALRCGGHAQQRRRIGAKRQRSAQRLFSCLPMPSGCVAWRSFPATFHHRRRRWRPHRRRRLISIPRLRLRPPPPPGPTTRCRCPFRLRRLHPPRRQRPANGSSAKRDRPSTIRRLPSPRPRPAPDPMASCKLRSSAVAAVPRW